MALAWLYGSDIRRDEKAGRKLFQAIGISLTNTDADAWRGFKWAGYAANTPPVAATAVTDLFFVNHQVHEDVIPGAFVFVTNWEGVITRTA